MGSEKFHNRYRIASERAPWNAYDDGAYFVTICTAHHEHYFGKICNGEMHHSVIGQFVADNLRNITAHYLYAEIPVFVVMPNHLHAIVCIDGNKIPYSRRVVAQSFDDGRRYHITTRHVETRRATSLRTTGTIRTKGTIQTTGTIRTTIINGETQ